MKERPILFSPPMVRALLAGRKTQTRREVRPTTGLHDVATVISTPDSLAAFIRHRCPYGQPGDRLWVRENGWQRPQRSAKQLREGADTWAPYYFDADGITDSEAADFKAWGFKRRPSIHMPRAACRIVLEVTGVRVERLHSISESDAVAEGIEPIGYTGPNAGPNRFSIRDAFGSANFPTAVGAYRQLWAGLNGAGNWNANPWVWVVEFRRC